MATYFRTKVTNNIGTTSIDVVQTAANNRFTIIGCNLANTTDTTVAVDVLVYGPDSAVAYYVKQLLIPGYNSAKLITNGEKLILAENCGLRIISDTDSSIDAVVSYAEII
jgi:hypothetical protein